MYALTDIVTNETASSERLTTITVFEPSRSLSAPPTVTPVAAETPHMNSTSPTCEPPMPIAWDRNTARYV
jgi:hypothetical protein